MGLMRPNRFALGPDTPATPSAAAAASSARATGCDGQRRPMLVWPAADAVPLPERRGTITVKGPGQNASASACAQAGHSAANARAAATSLTCTISGWSAGRPLAAKILATAASSSARAPRP